MFTSQRTAFRVRVLAVALTHRAALAGLALTLFVAATGCPSGEPAGETPTRDTISATTGGSLSTSRGVVLEVPPGALPADTEITLTELDAAALVELDSTFVAGVRLEPEGLTFSTPATLRVPLPAPWPEDADPIELVFKGADPASAVDTGMTVALSDDRQTAIFQVSHFSGRICANQCHAGVREYLTAQFAARGCTRDEWKVRVLGKYPGLELRDTCESITTHELGGMLDSFFDEVGAGWNAGQDVPAETLSQLATWANQGRNVVILFSNDVNGPRGGPHQFYWAAHSCVLEQKSGTWQMRHVFIPRSDEFINHIGGTNIFWWPLADLNNFRKQKSGVGLEVYYCGTPGCFGSDDPEDPLRPYDPLDKRGVPWDAVRIFVEREQNNPCDRLTGAWRFDTSDADGSGTFLIKVDDAGRVDSFWVSGQNSGVNGGVTVPDTAFAELFRFARANVPQLQAQNVEEAVFLNEDQTQFTMAFGLDIVSPDDEGREESVGFSFSINDAVLSQDQPDEFFEGELIETVTARTYDSEGNLNVEESTASAMVRARRVPCPDPAQGTGVEQGAFLGELDLELGTCGAGAAGAGSLTLVGLAGWKSAKRRATGNNRKAVSAQ